jgi:hypothetical protein
MTRILIVVGFISLCFGCGDSERGAAPPADTSVDVSTDVGTPDSTPDTLAEDTLVPPGPELIEAAGTVEASVEALYLGEVWYASSLGGNAVLVDTPNSLLSVSIEGEDPLLLTSELGPIHDVALLDDGTVLLAGSLGVYVEVQSTFIASPLGEHFADGHPIQLQSASLGDSSMLWLGANDGLHLWQDGLLSSVTIPDIDVVPTQEVDMAFGPEMDGDAALWLAWGTDVYAVSMPTADEDVVVWHVLEDAPGASLTSDASGQLWVASEGDLHRRSAGGEWTWYRIPDESVVSVKGNRHANGVWVATDERFWYSEDGQFFDVTGAVPEGMLSVDATGRVLMVAADGLYRVNPGEPYVPTSTWIADIEPLNLAYCAGCHGPIDYFVEEELYLDSPAQWEANIDRIVAAIKVDADGNKVMPLGKDPLSPEEQLLIKYWKLGGFLLEASP